MTNKELHESQEKLAKKLDDVIPLLEVVAKTAKSNEKVLHGEDRPGLIEEFTKVQTRQDECRAQTKARRSEILAVLALVVAALAPFIHMATKVFTK